MDTVSQNMFKQFFFFIEKSIKITPFTNNLTLSQKHFSLVVCCNLILGLEKDEIMLSSCSVEFSNVLRQSITITNGVDVVEE